MRLIRLYLIVISIWISAASCQVQTPVSAPTPDNEYLQLTRTSLDKTSVAIGTRVAAIETQTFTLTAQAAIPTSTPTFITFPTATPTPILDSECDQAEFIRDINLPPGSGLPPNTEFTKIWRLKNIGKCTWTENYTLAYFGGALLEADESVILRRTVPPGETIDISVFMRTPPRLGNYRGYWRLRNAQGQVFRIANVQNGSLAVDIRTGTPDKVVLDFTNLMCSAEWTNAVGRLPCPGTEGDRRGYVLRRNDPEVENSSEDDKPSILTVPEYQPDGMIQGKFPVFTPQFGDSFHAVFGCQKNAVGCDVMYQLNIERQDGSYENLAEWHEVYNNNSVNVNLDLSFLAGEPVKFLLVVYAYANPEGDRPLWVHARILGIR